MTRLVAPGRRAFTLIELIVVVVVIALLISILLPALSRVREKAQSAKLASESRNKLSVEAPAAAAFDRQSYAQNVGDTAVPIRPSEIPLALVKTFAAKVELTPRLSVGTAEPESIYEARFTATLDASAPANASSNNAPCEIRLPLPPQIISLAQLSVTVNNEPSDIVSLRDSTLVWTGPLPTSPTPITVTYAAVGKGLYELQTPPGRILDTFNLDLIANGSDVRMLELSLQPTKLTRGASQTTYTWNYSRLMFGRPIAVDVLGVAPVDRLGELRWLGPLSVVIFGLLIGLYAHAHALLTFDRWMLLLTLGAFTGAYPLMYFAQEFIPLPWAIAGSAGLVIGIIAARSLHVIGLRHTFAGVLMPALMTIATTLYVATHPQYQGLLLTAGAIAVFLSAMTLIPKLRLPTRPSAPTPTLSPA